MNNDFFKNISSENKEAFYKDKFITKIKYFGF